MVNSVFNLSLTFEGRRNSHHICSCGLRCPHCYEGIRQGRKGTWIEQRSTPTINYLLFLAQAVRSKEDASKSNSHSQHSSHLSKKIAEWKWPSSSQLCYHHQHFQQEFWDPRECMCASTDQYKQHEVKVFFRLQKKPAVIYMQSVLRRPLSQPPIEATFFILNETVNVSESSIHVLLWGYIS